MKIEYSKTSRGFGIYKFKDQYNLDCSLQESSLATEQCVWLGVHENRMHLTQEMAQEIINILQVFVHTGHLPDPHEESTKEMNAINISLNESDFSNLVSGKIIKKGSIGVALQDIGFDLMAHYVNESCISFHVANQLKRMENK